MERTVANCTFVFICLFLELVPTGLFAQIVAGEVPEGYILYQSDLIIEVEDVIVALDYIDLNFDGKQDLKFQLRKNSTEAIYASIFSEFDSVGICHLQGLNYTPSKIYEEGSLMECVDTAGFELAPGLVGIGIGRFNAGNVGAFPSQIENGYLHYEWKAENEIVEGWIKLSFDLTEEVIFLQVHEWIIKDEITRIYALVKGEELILFPNPVQNGLLYIDFEQNFESFEIYSLQGQLLHSGKYFSNIIQLGDLKGMLVLKLQTKKGEISEVFFAR